jgi:hypothetical protein
MTAREAYAIVWSAVCKGDLIAAAGRTAAKGGPCSISELVALLKSEAGVWEDHLLTDRERAKNTLRFVTERGRSELARVTAARTLVDMLEVDGLNPNADRARMPSEIIFKVHAPNAE